MDRSSSAKPPVDNHSLALEAEISDLRKVLSEWQCYTQPHDDSSMLKIAEGRLHDLIIRFNQLISLNGAAKDEIDVLRREKHMFHTIHDRMTRELRRVITNMSSLAQKSKADYAARDLAQSHIVNLRCQADKEHADFEKEWKELINLIENDKRMREFIQQKEMHERKARREVRDSEGNEACIIMADSPARELRAKLLGLQSQFELIKEATGLNTIEELISFFDEKGKKTFSLYKLLVLCMENIGQTEGAISSIRKRVQHGKESFSPHMEFSLASSDKSGRSLIDSRIEDINSKFAIMHKLLNSMYPIIRSSFEKLFPDANLMEMYLSPRVFAASAVIPIGSICDSNVIDYITAIENRVNDLVLIHGAMFPVPRRISNPASKLGHRKSLAILHHKTNPASHSMGSIVLVKMMQYKLPSSTDDIPSDPSHFEDPEEANRPLSRNEIRVRTLEHIKGNPNKGPAKRLNAVKPI